MSILSRKIAHWKKSMLAITIEHKLWFNWNSSSTYPSHCIFICYCHMHKGSHLFDIYWHFCSQSTCVELDKNEYYKIWIVKLSHGNCVSYDKNCISLLMGIIALSLHGERKSRFELGWRLELLASTANVISAHKCKCNASLSTWSIFLCEFLPMSTRFSCCNGNSSGDSSVLWEKIHMW